jgi:hypothetical protein
MVIPLPHTHYKNRLGGTGCARREEVKKVKIAPFRYRSTTQFSRIINAALFCAALTRSIKGHCKAGTKKPGPAIALNPPPQENTATIPRALSPTPARRPAGQGQGKGANPHAPFPCRFHQNKKTAVYPPPVF